MFFSGQEPQRQQKHASNAPDNITNTQNSIDAATKN